MSNTTTPTIDAGGELRKLSLKPRWSGVGDPRVCSGVMGKGEAPQIIPRGDWPRKGVDLSRFVHRFLDQDGHNTCWACAATGTHETALHLAGAKDVVLSWGHLAGQTNGGVDEGESIDATLPVLLGKGQAPASVVAEESFHPSRWTAEAAKEAEKFKLLHVWDSEHENCVESVVTGLILRMPAVIGTSAFGGGHAVEVTGFEFDEDGVLWWFGPNSWSERWSNWPGHPGYWRFSERRITQGLTMFGCWVLEAAAVNPDDVPPPATV